MRVKYDEVGTVTLSGRVLAGGVLGVLALGGLGYGSYELFWAAKANSVDRAAAINRQSLGFQQGKLDEINDELTAIQASGSASQKQAIQNQMCANWRQVTPGYRVGLDSQLVSQLNTMCVFQP